MNTEEPPSPSPSLQEWLDLATAALGCAPRAISDDERNLLLDLARIAAHRCERTAAPITAFVVGEALAGSSPEERVERLRRLVSALERREEG